MSNSEPENAERYFAAGVAQRGAGQIDEAIAAYRKAIELRPDFFQAYNNLGNALAGQGKHLEAIEAFSRAIAHRSDFADAYFNLGISLQATDQLDDAADAYHRAIGLRPSDVDAANGLGVVLRAQGNFDGAMGVFREGLKHRPDYAPLHWNLAQLLLARGEFGEGWKEFEWRLRLPGAGRMFPAFSQPRWDGSDLNGKRILLHAEQGFGDSIHFARYVGEVAKRGGKVILAIQPLLLRLFGSLEGADELVATDGKLPGFDVHCPLPSLPLALKMDKPFFGQPYLKAKETLEEVGKMKVGLIWAGRAHPPGRSISLEMLEALAHPKVQFYGLQVGEGAGEAKNPPMGMNFMDVGNRIADFADSGAFIAGMDLVISIDTAAAQLAGAMGKKVWTLLKFVPDWRWMLDRNDSPWYPTMKLFRQARAGVWAEPISRMALEFKKLADAFTPR
jgi:tetratricopeptide (TPR) repeat protein